MAIREFKLPDPGEGLLEAEIVEWKVAVGDTVAVNDIVVEVETAKSLVELPIPWAGTVTGIHVSVGDEVEVGTVIISIEDGVAAAEPPAGAPPGEEEDEPVKTLVGYGPKASGTTRRARRGAGMPPASASPAAPTPPAPATAPSAPPAPAAVSAPAVVAPAPAAPASAPASAPMTGERVRALAKPPVRKLANDLGIDLGAVPATGEGGIVTRADVEAYAAARASGAGSSGAGTTRPAESGAGDGSGASGAAYGIGSSARWGGEREVRTPIKGVRKMTAQAMVASAFTAPHVTEWVEVDVTATMELVARLRADREFRDVKVTPLTILAKAMCLAVRRNPGINASWDEAAQEIVEKRYVNLGIAAATPRGLLVPNIKDADALTLVELAGAINALTETARAGRTAPADQAGGTITITNVGVFGVDGGTPILNPGEAAILAFGQVVRKPWVVVVDGVERIEARSVTTLSLSFDHRLVDGELGSRFLADVAALLADPSRAFVWS